jgi:hypothetical protein
MRFHSQLLQDESQRSDSLTATHAIVGINQPTATTVHLGDGRIITKDTYGTEELFGDSTVPIVAACRADVPMDSNTLRRVPDKHGNLQRNRAALDELEGILTARSIKVRAAGTVELRVSLPELVFAGEALPVEATAVEDPRVALRIAVYDETDQLVEARVPKPTNGVTRTAIDGLPPGAYTVAVTGLSPQVAPISGTVLVWPGAPPPR